jgi:vancomycin resistance protein YoaR
MPLPSVPRPEGHRSFAWLGGAAAFGALLGLALVASESHVETPRPITLRCYGREIPLTQDAAETVLQWTTDRFEGWLNLVLPDGEERRLRYPQLGIEVDRERLTELLRDAPSSGRARASLGLDHADVIDLPVPVRIDRERSWLTLVALKDEVDRVPRDARIDLDRKTVVPERPGRLLDLDRSLAAIESALERGDERVALAFEATQPRRSLRGLADVRYDVLLGAYETSRPAASRDEERGRDLGLAASRLDGQVLMPGDILDFNALVGSRDVANGYQTAKAPAGSAPLDGSSPMAAVQSLDGSEPLDGTGGAMCQISGTLHAAALFAGLEIVERHAETRPSPYLELGMDAAVAYPALDLRVKNSYDFPVVFRATASGGRVRAEVRGARRPYVVTIVRKIDGATPYPQLEQPDDSLELDERRLVQRGLPGIDLHRYRIRRGGPHAVRQVVIDHHPPTPQLVRVGTGLSDASSSLETGTGRPPQGLSSEYLADELVVMMQSERLDGPLSERRVRGRFGAPGWTKDIGAPAWISPP